MPKLEEILKTHNDLEIENSDNTKEILVGKTISNELLDFVIRDLERVKSKRRPKKSQRFKSSLEVAMSKENSEEELVAKKVTIQPLVH